MICIIGVGLLLTVRTGCIQVRKFGVAMKSTLGKVFDKKVAKEGTMSPFQAVCTALAGTVGTGNIAGVAGAVALGGPGAVFWMWCSAFLGMLICHIWRFDSFWNWKCHTGKYNCYIDRFSTPKFQPYLKYRY